MQFGGGVAGAAARGLDPGQSLLRRHPAVRAFRAGAGRGARGVVIVARERRIAGAGLGDEVVDADAERAVVGDLRRRPHRLFDRQPLIGPWRQGRPGAVRDAAGEQEGGGKDEDAEQLHRPLPMPPGAGPQPPLPQPQARGCAAQTFPLCRRLPRARSSAG